MPTRPITSCFPNLSKSWTTSPIVFVPKSLYKTVKLNSSSNLAASVFRWTRVSNFFFLSGRRKIFTYGSFRFIKLKIFRKILIFNRYRRKCSKVNAGIFDSALSHTRRSDASEKRRKILASTFGRFRLWTSFESSPVSVKYNLKNLEYLSLTLLNLV